MGRSLGRGEHLVSNYSRVTYVLVWGRAGVAKKDAADTSGNGGERARGASADERVAAAAAAVEQARAALQQAQEAGAGKPSGRAGRKIPRELTVTLGDVLDGTLDFVRRHPGAGVLGAGLIGFFIGRSTKR